MAYKIRWTENAFEDLKETFNYLENEWSFKISKEFLENCFLNIELISKFPYLGIQSTKDKSVRKISVSKYLVLYYRIEKEFITLLNFFDTRRDPEKIRF